MSNSNRYAQYATVILSIAEIRFMFIKAFPRIASEHKLNYEHEEYLYDWLVTEALSKVLENNFQSQVFQHYRHDIYKCVYDSIGKHFERVLHHQIQIHNLQFMRERPVKVLVTADNLILARNPHSLS